MHGPNGAFLSATTAAIPDNARGDYADLLILDEFQLMRESMWDDVAQPMLVDNEGTALLIFTPPSPRMKSASYARDKMYAIKVFKAALLNSDWATFQAPTNANPHISEIAIERARSNMSAQSFRVEFLAEVLEEAEGAMWTRQLLEETRVDGTPDLVRVVVGVDPAGTRGGDQTGIVVAGVDNQSPPHGYVLADCTISGSPQQWANAAIGAYYSHEADRIVAERNFGGDMVEHTLRSADPDVAVHTVQASRGKAVRAEPIAAMFEQGRVHMAGSFADLEDQLCLWTPSHGHSPDRLDAMVWSLTDLMFRPEVSTEVIRF